MWSRLNFSDKLAFFNLWHITSTFGDLMLVIGSGLTFSREVGLRADSHERYGSPALVCQLFFSRHVHPEEKQSLKRRIAPRHSLSLSDIMHAIGGFLAWVSLLKFCEWSAELYMLMLAVKASFGRVIRFIFTVSPVYIGMLTKG